MATIALEDLIKPLTVDEVKASIYRVLELSGVSTTVWKPGAVVRTMIAAAAIVLAALSSLTALIARSGFLSLSSGLWKKLVALHSYNVEKQEATFASGVGLLSNSSGGTYILAIGDLVVAASVSGKSYVNTTAVTLNPGSTNVPCSFQASEGGSASTAFIGEVNTVVTALTGVTVTNAVAWVGLDEESDAALQARCDEKLGALSPNGPADSYAHFAKIAKRADGTLIGVTRVRVVPDGSLNVDVYVATASGGVVGTMTDPSTDLGAIHDLIQKNCVPIPITERTNAAPTKAIEVTYEAWMYNTRGLTEAQIKDSIAKALAAMIPTQPIGGNVVPPASGKIYHEHIRSAIVAATSSDGIPLGIFHANVTTPAGDVTLTSNEAPTIGAITATAINQIAPPKGAL